MKKLLIIIGLLTLTACQPQSIKEPIRITDPNGNQITQGCQSWFDGCNTCSVEWEKGSATCTEMACLPSSAKEPKCLDEPKSAKEVENKPISYKVEAYLANLEIPWDMAFTSENRMLITERPGRLRVAENGALKKEPLHVFKEVSSTGEEGLMSVEIDPYYDENKWIYLSLAYQKSGEMKVKVVRFTDEGDRLTEETVILDNLPAARYHAGCRLAFGPDEKLYITIGDALDKRLAQNLDSLAGKTLRVNKDGSIPEDNPFENSAIWSYGHRNSQGIDWNEDGQMFATEHGPSTFDGPPGGDEVNLIKKGGNYGWPLVSHNNKLEGTEPPLIQFTPAEPPASLLTYSGQLFPQWKNHLFFGSLRGEGLIHITLNETGDQVASHEKLFTDYGRIRNVMEGPDGAIYFSTSNKDGRGSPTKEDDQIFKITPHYEK